MSGSESIMSIFVLSPALGTPLTLPTAAHPPPLLSTSNWEHPELETHSHLTENGGQCMNCLFLDLLFDRKIALMTCFRACEESHLWKKYRAKESKTLMNQCALGFSSIDSLLIQKQWCLLAVGTQADSTSDHGQPSNIRIWEQCNVTVFFSAKYSILIFPRFPSTTLPLSTNCSVKCVLAVFQHQPSHLMLAALLGPWGQCAGYRRGAWCQFALFTNHSPFHPRSSPVTETETPNLAIVSEHSADRRV